MWEICHALSPCTIMTRGKQRADWPLHFKCSRTPTSKCLSPLLLHGPNLLVLLRASLQNLSSGIFDAPIQALDPAAMLGRGTEGAGGRAWGGGGSQFLGCPSPVPRVSSAMDPRLRNVSPLHF